MRLFSRFAKSRSVWSPPIVYRLALNFTAVVVLGMGVLGYLVVSYQNDLMLSQTHEYGTTIVSQYADGATDLVFTEDDFGLGVFTSHLVSDSRILGAAIYNNDGASRVSQGLVLSQLPPAKLDQVTQLSGDYRAITWNRDTSKGDQELVSFLSPVSFKGVVAGQALVTFSREAIRRSYLQTIRTLIIVTLATTLLSLCVAFWISRRLAKPIKQLVAATDELAAGNYNVVLRDRRGDELGQLVTAVNHMAKSLREKHQVEGLLSCVVDDGVAKKMLSQLDRIVIDSERVDASVLFVDIVGFTRLTERSNPEDVVSLLNEYFSYFTQCSRLFHGAVDKFIGDCAMVIFGAPAVDPNHRFNSVACAVAMQRLVAKLNERRVEQGLPVIEVCVGVNSGEMMAGTIGARQRMEYTVIGDSVNVASRLCGLAGPGEIVIGEGTYASDELAEKVLVLPHDLVSVKGKVEPLKTFRLTGLHHKYQQRIDGMIDDILLHKEAVWA